MKRIAVYEDNVGDIIGRYGEAAKSGHEVSVEFFRTSPRTIFEQDGRLTPNYAERFTDAGFDVARIRTCNLKDIPQADVYFVDGLGELWTQVARHLPKDRTYIASDRPDIRATAEANGYRACKPWTDVLDILAKL